MEPEGAESEELMSSLAQQRALSSPDLLGPIQGVGTVRQDMALPLGALNHLSSLPAWVDLPSRSR